MQIETISEQLKMVIRRMILDPGESMFWHRGSAGVDPQPGG